MVDASLNKPAQTQGLPLARADVFVGLMLVLVMLVGGYFRFMGQNWDDFTHLHPDERLLTDVASSLNTSLRPTEPNPIDHQTQLETCRVRYPDTNGAGSYFDAQCSLLNPHNVDKGLYVYGTLPVFLARGAGDVVAQITGSTVWTSYSGVHLVWRSLSAFAEMAVILLVFLIGLRLHGKWVGLLAAALYAAAVFSIQQAHFGTVDAMSNLFATLAIYFAVRVQDEGGFGNYALFGLALAAALASRVNLAPLAGLVVLAAIIRALPALDAGTEGREREKLILQNTAGLMLAGAVTLVGFRVMNPYAFMGPGILGLTPNPRWLADIAQAQHLVSGAAEMPPNWQWVARTPYLFPLSNMSLWGMGIALAVAGWAGWLWSGWRALRGRPGAVRNLLLVMWVLVYFGWLGRNWVSSMRYFLPLYPVLALLAAWLLVELVRRARGFPARRALAWALLVGVVGFTYLWALMFTNVYRHQLTRVQASHWIWENVCGDFCMEIEGAPPGAPLVNIGVANGFGNGSDHPLVSQASVFFAGQDFTQPFTAHADGLIHSVRVPHLGSLEDDGAEQTVRVALLDESSAILSETTLTADFRRDGHVLGERYVLELDSPVEVAAGQRYILQFQVQDGSPVITAGEVVSHEGAWDDAIPYTVCTLPEGVWLAHDPPPGLLDASNCNGRNAWSSLINGYEMQLAWEDEQVKRERILRALDDSEYLTVSSNRFYDGVNRIPIRWPMTNVYYKALFGGELGYELTEVFQETFELGPLKVSDQYLPIYDAPEWLNEFEAEEAFHVYDHPVVFIFRKTDAYDSAAVHALLNSVPMTRVSMAGFEHVDTCPSIYLQAGGGGCDTTLLDTATLSSLEGDVAPTQFMLTDSRRETQYQNGTWSDRFDSDSPLNTQPIVTVAVWWFAIVSFGWVAWPLLFTLFPFFADRGYAFAKLVGVFLTGWLAWYTSSVGVPLWSQAGIVLILMALAVVSVIVLLRQRARFAAYVRQHWRRLLGIEIITLVAFVAFLAVRLTNPDLWHPSFGGEKPMDFAYFNGILRSTTFPPVDPWYAGGFMNYYYFGFVVVGTPVLLLGIVPSIAYNLIVPTMFALTGIGAFGVAFNLVSHFRERRREFEDDEPRLRPVGSPWVAGLAALMLAVVLGNLDTPRVFGTGIAEIGGYQRPTSLQDFLVREYTAENGLPPSDAAMFDLMQRAQENQFGDRLRYELSNSAELARSLVSGTGRMLAGEQLPIATNRWFWAPTRVLSETPGVEGNAITEFPYFTFLYGDLHAHMISMALMLLAMAFILHEVLAAGRDTRGRWAQFFAMALGALTVGMLRATNTWDWPTFMILSVAGLGFAWWLHWRRIHRRSVINFALRVGGFVALSFLFVLPFTTWYATVYGSILPWTGGKTPLWAYFDLHGVFLFLIFSLLVWDTGRWLRSVYVSSLRGMGLVLVSLALGVLAVLVASVIVAAAEYQVALVAIPLLLWIAILFFRQGQSREMQYVLALTGLALGLTLGVEVIVIGGDIGRQNTVFKFYIQAWILFSVVGGAAFAWLLSAAGRWSPVLRNGWYAIASILFVIAALYPIMASRAKALERMADVPFTLDGMEYMKYASQGENNAWIPLEDEYRMIRWLQENVEGTPVIIETQSWREYLWGGRVSIYTGLPSILGWRFHQTQQRTMEPLIQMVNQRRANINGFYATMDIANTWAMIRHYDIRYIIVGGLERAYFSAESLAKFDTMAEQGLLEKVYEQGQSVVYQVNEDADFTAREVALAQGLE